MRKLSVCVLFGGISPEHEVSLRSAESVLNNIDHTKYHVFPVGITKGGDWIHFTSRDYSLLPSGQWEQNPGNRRAAISPVRGQGLLTFEGDCVVRERIDVVFPVLHGANGEDGAMQGLLQLAGIPYVGSHVAASAVAMDKTLTKLVADQVGVRQAAWRLVWAGESAHQKERTLASLEERFRYPMCVTCREELSAALDRAAQYDRKILVEEFIRGREIEVAVMGNDSPVASICGEIDSGAEFYDYEAKYVTDTSQAYIPARISEETEEAVRDAAVRIYQAIGCQGLSRVDFFVTYEGEDVIFNEINTLPGFTSISMYPKLFAASGIPYPELIDQLIALACEVRPS